MVGGLVPPQGTEMSDPAPFTYRDCIHCKKSIKRSEVSHFVIIELIYVQRSFPSTLWFHVPCFQEVAGDAYLDDLNKEMGAKLDRHGIPLDERPAYIYKK